MTTNDLLVNNHYPLNLQFKIGTIYNDFTATDALGNEMAYVKEKLFKFKEHVIIYTNTSKSEIKFEIKANKWLDFNASYLFTNASGNPVGRVVRKGWKSLWKCHYIIFDENDTTDLEIRENNAWVKVWDALLSEVPILGMFTGYVFNPSYSVKRPDGTLVCTVKKSASFFGRKFKVDAHSIFEKGEEDRILLSVMMMLLLERRRG
jgi:uncharacterized protein YxjI